MLFLKNEKGEVVTKGSVEHIARTIGVTAEITRRQLQRGEVLQAPGHEGWLITSDKAYFGTTKIIGKQIPQKTHDCLAFDKEKCACTALNQTYCLWEKCNFYKKAK